MNADHQTFLDLISLLEEEESIYTEMEELLEAERGALLQLAASELAEICSRKETLALRIKALDESRKVMSERLGKRYGILPENLTVTELCRFAPPALAERLDQARLRLRARAGECKSVNDYNSRAARRGLDLVSGAIEHLLAGPDPAGKLYQKKSAYSGARARVQPAVISREA